LYARALAKPDSDRHPSYRYKLSVCYWGSTFLVLLRPA
jgi:hypothetical protein